MENFMADEDNEIFREQEANNDENEIGSSSGPKHPIWKIFKRSEDGKKAKCPGCNVSISATTTICKKHLKINDSTHRKLQKQLDEEIKKSEISSTIKKRKLGSTSTQPTIAESLHSVDKYGNQSNRLLSALQSLFQIAHLRSVSIAFDGLNDLMLRQILAIIKGLNVKGNLEYLHLCWGLTLPVEFIINLIRDNPKLSKLVCAIRHDRTLAELDELKILLENMDRPLELELIDDHCASELLMGKNGRVRVGFPERISQPMLRHFWARAMHSVPDLGNLDD